MGSKYIISTSFISFTHSFASILKIFFFDLLLENIGYGNVIFFAILFKSISFFPPNFPTPFSSYKKQKIDHLCYYALSILLIMVLINSVDAIYVFFYEMHVFIDS